MLAPEKAIHKERSESEPMTNVAVVTDSASDLPPDRAAAAGITVVPLLTSFGQTTYRAGVELTTERFWDELTKPGAPFPTTAAAGPGVFQETFQRLLDGGADEVVYVGVGSKLSATFASARLGAEGLPGRAIHLVDTDTACMGIGLLALLASEMAAAGATGAEIAAEVERRKRDTRIYVVLETLEYLKRGGRISGAQAAIGGLLSVKPIITVEDGVVETVEKVRTRHKARERLLDLLAEKPVERVELVHCRTDDIETFGRELAERIRFPRERMGLDLIGPSVGPHVGPGAYGAIVLLAAAG